MKPQVAVVLICLLRTTFGLPVRIGLFSASNEFLGLNALNGLTLSTLGQAQANTLLPSFVPEVLLNLNPQVAGPFGPQGPVLLPSQGNQLTPVIVPNGQQEALGPAPDPNAPTVPQQAQPPLQMFPQFQYPAYGYPQLTRQQGFSYYMPRYGYPQQRNVVPQQQPNNGQAQPSTNLDRTTQRPQLPLQQASQPKVATDSTWPLGTNKESTTITPELRGDASGPGVDEGHSNFPFLFEP